MLGEGAFGKVYKVVLRSEKTSSNNPTVYAAKLMDVPVDKLETVINEFKIMSKVNHRNIIKIYEGFQEKDKTRKRTV